MSDAAAPRSIYRPEVVKRFTERQEQPVLPRYIRPRTFVCLWLLLALIATFAAAGWQVRVPERIAGTAAIVAAPGGIDLIGFVPAGEATRLETGQAIDLRLPGRDGTITATVASVDADPRSPADAAALVDADPSTLGLTALGPVTVVRATLPDGVDVASWAGSGGSIEITVGHTRLTRMLLPVGIAPALNEEKLP